MKEYKLTQVQRREEWSGQYGPMVTYAIALEGEEGWVKLNQKPTTPAPEVGSTLTGEIQNDIDPQGNRYKKFRKINPQYANQNAPSPPSAPQDNSKIDYIVKMLEELTGRREVSDEPSTPAPPAEQDPFAGLDI